MSTVAHEQPRPDQEYEYIVADGDGDEDEDWGVVDYQSDDPESEPKPEIIYHPPPEVQEAVKHSWDDFRRAMLSKEWDEDSLLEGEEKVYSTSQAAKFFGRSNQWVYWGLREGIFTYKNGDPILPERAGTNGRRRFTLPLIREIALSCYRRGQIQEPELHDILAKVLLAEFGKKAFSDTGG
jgi:hypothetical protein